MPKLAATAHALPVSLFARAGCDRPRRMPGARRGGVGLLALTACLTGGSLLPATARASVNGPRGIEIEGPKDRRGFMGGVGLGMINTVFLTTDGARLAPAPAIDAVIGGGVTKRFTIGARLTLAPYAAPQIRGAVAAGGDIEFTGFVYKGLYLRGGVGLMAIPEAWNDRRLTAGPGGRAGLGYEFFLNQTAAMDIGLAYDLRLTTEIEPRHSVVAGFRFMFY